MAACGFGHCPFQLSVRVDCLRDSWRFRTLALSPCGVFLQDGAVHVRDWRSAEWRLPGLDRDGAMPCLAALGVRRLPGLSWRPEHLKPPLPVQSWSVALRYNPADVAGLFRLFFDAHPTSMRRARVRLQTAAAEAGSLACFLTSPRPVQSQVRAFSIDGGTLARSATFSCINQIGAHEPQHLSRVERQSWKMPGHRAV
jgi:hypothetical protein